jgi:hypothetical protein
MSKLTKDKVQRSVNLQAPNHFWSLDIFLRLELFWSLFFGACFFPSPSHAAPATAPADRIASWQIIGDTSQEAADRYVTRPLFQRGWATCMDKLLSHQVRWGCRRLLLRNPFGATPSPDGNHLVDFTQYQQALKQTPWLTQDFVPQMKNLTKQGIEVVAYIGNPDSDSNIQKVKSDPKALAEMLQANVQPYLDAGMSIGLDACVLHDDKSISLQLARDLRQRGVRVYVEARPPKDMPWWYDFPVICEQNFWERSDPAKFPDAAQLYARNEQLTGEIILIVVPDGQFDWSWPNAGKWEKRRTLDVLKSGKTAACPVGRFLEFRQTRKELE